MRFSKLTLCLTAVLSAAFLTACGSSNNDVDYVAPEPPSSDSGSDAPATIDFPVQVAAPGNFTLDGTGTLLTAENGLSLYFFANDQNGVSNCNGAENDEAGSTTDAESCAGTWPPLLADAGAETTQYFTTITRDDGTSQWAYLGYPVYTFSNDSAQGDINGDGVGGVWDLARPKATRSTPINDITTYVGNQTVLTASSVNQELETARADLDGHSLYIFDSDPINDATCFNLGDGGCINTWPPLLADNAAKTSGDLSILELENGLRQWAFKGKAMYFFSGDSGPEQTNGDGVGNVWHLATRLPALVRNTAVGDVFTATGLAYVAVETDGDPNTAPEAERQDKDQFTLYVFDNDVEGQSNCAGGCAQTWPPFLAGPNDVAIGNFDIITRDDGLTQWTWNDRPVYFFSGDEAIGDANGDGIGGVWHTFN